MPSVSVALLPSHFTHSLCVHDCHLLHGPSIVAIRLSATEGVESETQVYEPTVPQGLARESEPPLCVQCVRNTYASAMVSGVRLTFSSPSPSVDGDQKIWT